ncbi:MAG: FAD-dependent oxidoreductase [Clostridia bacterium]|nr:FAD-dependent oxidoreductase [Clostridia bacterium]
MRRQTERFQEAAYDVLIVGGGMSGLCAALASARHGANTALVNSRPVLGGNASSEIRIHISGADQGTKQPDYAEGGILYELMLENKSRNETFNYSIWDMILFEAAQKQKNLTVYHNTVMYDCELDGQRITAVNCVQETTEMRLRLTAKVFVDATGNGTLGYYAGADYRSGSEAKSEFNEPHAPDEPNHDRMGNTIMMKAVALDHPVKFQTPAFAKHLTEKQLAKRIHCRDMRDQIDVSDSPDPEEYKRTSMISSAASDYGYWWCELMGDGEDIIPEYEQIRDQLMAYAYGIWDHIKNNDEHKHDHHAENLALDWVGALPGMRESRRMEGDYWLTENDILNHRIFDDAICYGGWCIDMHAPHGLLDENRLPSDCNFYQGVYTIPYRSYYSHNVDNLMFAGRDISASRMAMASTRILGCCAIGGEAVGLAAARCIEHDVDPRGLAPYIGEVQQDILRDGGFLPGFVNNDTDDLAQTAVFSASSFKPGCEPDKLKNGISRKLGDDMNGWVSDGLSAQGETLTMSFNQPTKISQLRFVLHSDFKYPIRVTMSPNRQAQQRPGVPAELLKDYEVELISNGKTVRTIRVHDNHQRLNILDFDPALCDTVRLHVISTHGSPDATVFEVRAYSDILPGGDQKQY